MIKTLSTRRGVAVVLAGGGGARASERVRDLAAEFESSGAGGQFRPAIGLPL